MNRVREAAIKRLTSWSARRHGRDTLPMIVNRRRIYIIPTRFGIALALLLVAMLIAGLNYNSNLGLAFGFLMVSLALVAMHHCHRNLLDLSVDAIVEVDAFAGDFASFEILLCNQAGIDRCDLEIRMHLGVGGVSTALVSVVARGYQHGVVSVPVTRRGVTRLERFELRTRYPFGWFRAWTYVHSPLTAFVAPRPGGDRALPSASAAIGTAAHSEVRGDEDFAGLRAYEAGVSLKHMAWKVLARGGEPAVRSYTGPAAEPEWLDWTTLHPLGVEARLSQLCRWVLLSEAAQRAYGLRIPGTDIAPSRGAGHRSACLRALARYPSE
ncbi:MAG TPA: DUF58 domain-containing protein [Steroidobacteraceae bacterium]|nr:DUF58 domain-containing protein [Steroidobacteraceae bacterium]